ncbi:glycosyltransferase family A protein [Paracoccaceae bacterium Fryx2]|nr:glycosyltransferase family A protein [Paracoccaceae bacterium Fryx2]
MTRTAAPLPTRCTMTRFGTEAGWEAAIVIPARDEDRRITRCLAAAARAIDHGLREAGIVVVVNNSRDGTASRVADWAALHPSHALVLLDCEFGESHAGVGASRRLGLDLACRTVAPDGVLLTTDADTCVHPDWVAQNLAELQGADLICGTVLGDPDEAALLPKEIAAHGSAEGDYVAASVALAAMLDPLAHDPDPAHHNPAGASLAFPRRVYTAVGGMPVMRVGEDRAFAEAVEAMDFRLRFSRRAIVETSCRMTGRTDGGMAGALRSRARDADPFADEWLEPAATFALRHSLRGRLRDAWPNLRALRDGLAALLGDAEADRLAEAARPRQFGMFFAGIEASAPALARVRLRLSDCRRELPRLRALLSAAREARIRYPAAAQPVLRPARTCGGS